MSRMHDMTPSEYERGFENGYAAAEPKWIGIKDKLPPEGMNILVANIRTGTQYVSHRDLIHKSAGSDGWFAPTSYMRSFEFTHWMPLPKPPKEGEIV